MDSGFGQFDVENAIKFAPIRSSFVSQGRGGKRCAPFFREGGKCVANRGSFSNKLFADLFYAGLLNTSVLFARRISDGKFEIKREESSNIVQRDFFSLTR